MTDFTVPIADVIDNSGLEFFYTSIEPLHIAGTLSFGHWVRPSMVIPPKAENFLVEGFCHSSCTEKVRSNMSTAFGIMFKD